MADPLVDLANSLRPFLDQYWQQILAIIFLAGAYAAYHARGRPSKPKPEIQDKPPTPPAPAPKSTQDVKADGCVIFQDYIDLSLKVPIRVELPAGWSEENYRKLIRPHLLEAMRSAPEPPSAPSEERMGDVAELQDIDYAQLEADLNGAQPPDPQEPPPPAPTPSTQTDEKKKSGDALELFKLAFGGDVS